jgi:aspartyl-tRNA(Asn)/glutamyl-tRNA(Gln) amidotransferase subunit C
MAASAKYFGSWRDYSMPAYKNLGHSTDVLDSLGKWDILAGDLEQTMSKPEQEQAITAHLFEHLVDLASLELSPEEAEYLRRELNNQLKAIDELEAIPLSADTPVTTHGVPYSPQITPDARHDQWQACPNPEQILAQAPEIRDGYVVVPDIPHTDLD